MRFSYRKALAIAVLFFASVFLWSLALRNIKQQKSDDVDINKLTMPVVGVKARRQTIAEKMDMVGTLRADDAVEIRSETEGTIKEINFSSGQKVKKGDRLVLFHQALFNASLLQAEANLTLAKSTLKRYQALLKSGGISRLDFDQAGTNVEVARAQLDSAKAQFKSSIVLAPFDGVMGQRAVSVGQSISRGDSLGFLVNQGSMKADFRVPEKYLSRIKDGQAVQIKVEAYPQDRFNGDIVFISPTVDEATRTVLITAAVPNPDGKLRQGMFVDVSLVFNERPGAITVPEEAVVLKGDQSVVYEVLKDQTVLVKPVDCGLRVDGRVEILKGLEEGETVIIEGFQKVHFASKVKVRLKDQ